MRRFYISTANNLFYGKGRQHISARAWALNKLFCGDVGYKMNIRNETTSDIEAISKVTLAAFQNLAISNHTEQFIIKALRNANALTLSLVAEVDGKVVGHIAFSPITISDGSLNWYGLGPISVLPEYQKQGIGKSLILKGLSLLKGKGGQGCALVGEPDYYKRFGFKNIPDLIHEGLPQEVFLALPFSKKIPRGTVAFHKGFWVTC
jgi:putative acetyltransferase